MFLRLGTVVAIDDDSLPIRLADTDCEDDTVFFAGRL